MIIFRYLTKEVAIIAITATLILFFVFASNQLLHFLYYAAAGRLTAKLAMQMLLFSTPELLGNLLPLSLFLAILLAYGRMYANNEMTVLFSCGVSHAKLFRITMIFAAFFVIIIAVLMLWISPKFNKHADDLFTQSASSPIELTSPGQFQSMANDAWIFYAAGASNNNKKLYNVFITKQQDMQQENPKKEILVAKEAYQKIDKKTGDSFIVFDTGKRYVGTPGEKDYQITTFSQYWLRIQQQSTDYKEHSLPTLELWHNYDNLAAAELQWRFSMPIMAFILAIMAIPLSQVKTRRDSYAQLIPAILLYAIYSEGLMLSRSWIHQDILPKNIGMWWVHGVMLLVSIWLIIKQVGWRRVWTVLKS